MRQTLALDLEMDCETSKTPSSQVQKLLDVLATTHCTTLVTVVASGNYIPL